MPEPGRVLVTGSSGYIGTALVPALAAAGYTVTTYGHAPAAVHLAYNTAGGDYFTNVYAVAAAVEQAHAHDRFVFASTLNAAWPLTAYEREKALAERLVLARADLSPVILRLGCVYGPPVPWRPRHDRGVLNRVIQQAVDGEPPRLYGNVRGARDYVHLADVLAAFLVALHPETPAGSYDVGTGISHSLETAAKVACQEAGPGPLTDPRQLWPSVNPGDCYARHYPIALETRWLPGWEPTILLRDGIRQTAAWLRERRSALLPTEPETPATVPQEAVPV